MTIAPVLAKTRRRGSLCASTAASLTLVLTVLGCAARRPVTIAEIDLAADRAYRTLVESLEVDVSAVRGRTIVLDPGHGGGYRGARGRRGTAESDVNLAVALFLWGLLEDAGARVHLTRAADRDFVGGEIRPPSIQPLPSESPLPGHEGGTTPPAAPIHAPAESLQSDLTARVLAANALAPDLFLSLHHNADASGDTTRNQTQTYYRLGDAGPSLDAAQAIHRHLMRNLGTASGQVMPGNFHVLRNSTAVAAVLGEPSFITNPIFEEKLIRIDRVELEAAAYFLGIVDYFSRGIAQTLIALDDPAGEARSTELRARFVGSAIDPATVQLLIDDVPLTAVPVMVPGDSTPGASVFAASPPHPLPNGRHEVTARGRCLGGNAAAPAQGTIEIRRPPAEIRAEPWPPWRGPERVETRDPSGRRSSTPAIRGPLGLEVSVLDRFGMAVADSTLVELLNPARQNAMTRAGKAWFRLSGLAAADSYWHVRAGAAEVKVPVTSPGALPAWSGTVNSAGSGAPVGGAEIRDEKSGELLGQTNPDGAFAIPAPIAPPQVTARGYLPGWLDSPETSLGLVPILGGILHGRKIVIDAAGGGSEPLYVSATGVRASDTALDIARRLQAELTRAGARPTLTRLDDRTLPDMARVEAAERAAAELLVRIGAGSPPRIRHYPGSQGGTPLAIALSREIEVEAGVALPVSAEVTPILLHTSMPAVEVLLPPPVDLETEDLHLDPDFRRRLTRSLVLGLAADLGLPIDRQLTAVIASQAPRFLLDRALIIPRRGAPTVVVRGLEAGQAEHRIAPLDGYGRSGAELTFSAGRTWSEGPGSLRLTGVSAARDTVWLAGPTRVDPSSGPPAAPEE